MPNKTLIPNICIFYHTENSGGTKSILRIKALNLENLTFILAPHSWRRTNREIRRNIIKIFQAKIIIINNISVLKNPIIILLSYYFSFSRKDIYIYWHSSEWDWSSLKTIIRTYGIENNYLKRIYRSKLFMIKMLLLIKKSKNIVPSNFSANWLRNKFKILHPINVLYEAIDLKLILKLSKESMKIKFRENSKVIIAIGNNKKRKGFHLFLEVCESVPNDYIFVWIGKKVPLSEQLEDQIERINERSGFRKIQIIDFTPNPYPLLKNCDFFFLPSLEEPLGIVYLEALALGKFIICPKNKCGFVEIINGNQNLGYAYEKIQDLVNLFRSNEIDNYIKGNVDERLKKAQLFDLNNYINNFFKIILKSNRY